MKNWRSLKDLTFTMALAIAAGASSFSVVIAQAPGQKMSLCIAQLAELEKQNPDTQVSSTLDFNDYIVRAIDLIVKERSGRGFDHPQEKYYTQDLDYAGAPGAIRSNNKRGEGRTMCVAAVTETIIEALNIYWREAQSDPVERNVRRFQLNKVPAKSWGRYPDDTKKLDLRPYIFTTTWCMISGKTFAKTLPRGSDGKTVQCDPTKDPRFAQFGVKLSDGTGEALAIFGIGRTIEVSDLRAGDFVNFDRDGKDREGKIRHSGHATVFLQWIEQNGRRVGFEYFSAQNDRNGFGSMRGYFSPYCPQKTGIGDDCGINENTLVVGRIHHPSRWAPENAIPKLKLCLKKLDLLWPWQIKEIEDTKFLAATRKDPLGPSIDMKAISTEMPTLIASGSISIRRLQGEIDAVFNEPMSDLPNPIYGKALIDAQ